MDEKLLEELLKEKSKGARRDRLLSRIAALVVVLALLAGMAFGVQRLTGKTLTLPLRPKSDPVPTEEPTQTSTEDPAQVLTEAPSQEDPTEEPAETPTQEMTQDVDQNPTEQPEPGNDRPTEGDNQPAGDGNKPAGDGNKPTEGGSKPTEGSETPTGEQTHSTEPSKTVAHTLQVIWPEGYMDQPQTVYFQVKHDGEEVALLELNEAVRWQASWEDSYSVETLELQGKYPDDLTCAVTMRDENYIIHLEPGDRPANTSAQGGDSPVAAGTEDNLPQTGGDWLSPAALLLAGVILLGAGIAVKGRQDP